MQGLIRHNLMDETQYESMRDASLILKNIIKNAQQIRPDFDVLIFDIFLLCYKYKVTYDLSPPLSPSQVILLAIGKHPYSEKVRLRTRGSSTETYLVMKLLTDLLFEKLRGTEVLRKLSETLNAAQKEPLNIFEAFKCSELDALKSIFEKEKLTDVDLFSTLKTIHRWLNDGGDPDERSSDPHTQPSTHRLADDASDDASEDLIDASLKRALRITLDNADETPLPEQKMLEAMNQLEDEIEDYKENLSSAFIDRFAPYIKSFKVSSQEGDAPVMRVETPLDESEQTSMERIVSGKPMPDNAPTRLEILDAYTAVVSELNKQLHLDDVLNSAAHALDQFDAQMEILGLSKASLNPLSFDEIINLYIRTQNHQFVSFINKVGKKKSNLHALTKKKKKMKVIPKDRIVNSDKIDYLIDDELITLALNVDAFENDFYDRYLSGSLLTNELKGEDEKHKGPIILCYDGSGSMKGPKIEETKALVLAAIEHAKLQRRPIVLIQFASATEPLFIKSLNPLSIHASDLLEIIDTFICGGTNFKKPLQAALGYIQNSLYKKSDILFVTDGQCEIDPKFKKSFMQIKRERHFKLYTVIIHSHTYNDYGDIGEISDEILDIKGDHLSDWNEKIDAQIFQMI